VEHGEGRGAAGVAALGERHAVIAQELGNRLRALEVEGRRYDIGARFGLLRAQIALAMAGQLRDEVLATMVEAMAESSRSREGG